MVAGGGEGGGIGDDEPDDDEDAISSKYNMPPGEGGTAVRRMTDIQQGWG